MSKSKKPRPADAKSHAHPGEGGRPVPTHATEAEQARETLEAEQARNAEASTRDHMVDIGRGNQQAGRQSQ